METPVRMIVVDAEDVPVVVALVLVGVLDHVLMVCVLVVVVMTVAVLVREDARAVLVVVEVFSLVTGVNSVVLLEDATDRVITVVPAIVLEVAMVIAVEVAQVHADLIAHLLVEVALGHVLTVVLVSPMQERTL